MIRNKAARKSMPATKTFLDGSKCRYITTPEPTREDGRIQNTHIKSFSQGEDELEVNDLNENEDFELDKSWVNRSIVYHPK